MEYGFYLYGRILKRRLNEIADIGFMTGRGTGDAVFILRRLTEKCWSKGKKLFFDRTLKFYPETLKYWWAAGSVLLYELKLPL